MINKALSLVILFVLLSFCCLAEAKNIKMRNDKELLSNSKPAYVPSELLVKYKPFADTAAIKHFHDRLNIKVLKKMKRAKLRHVKLPPDLDVEEAVKLYKSDPNVEYAEPNYYRYAEASTPNDADFSDLWGLHNTGQTVNGSTGTADADIDAPEAWDICTGSSDVIIAVIDSGVAYDHPELAPNIWTNTGEVADNGVDDDGNGYVDDTQGWDFVEDDNDPMDYSGHGTHVAGTIAGVSNNTRGITGVMWVAQIMPLRFLDTLGSGTTADAISAIDYAIDNGAKILNNSWGGGAYSLALKEAIERAEIAGAFFIAAAGNTGDDNDSTPHYPSSYDVDNIIAVAATDQNDNLASFSNYGATSVDVAAPGTNTYSTIPAREVVFSDDFDDGNITDWTTGGTNNTWDVTTEAYHSGSYSLTDSPDTDYLNNTDSWAGSPPIDLSGKQGCKWVYYMNLDVEYGYDFLFIETSTDNTTWTYLTDWTGSTGGNFYEFEEDLTDYNDEPNFYVRFRLDSDFSITPDGAYIDDVELTCYSSDYSADTQYDHFNGTSMATPHVSGLAGLIWSHCPSLTYSQVKDYILNGVDIVSDLSGKIVTNGRVNAYTSLILASPPTVSTSSASSVTSSSATLNGTVNPNGLSASYYFEYGTTASYGSTTTSDSAGAGNADVPVSDDITGLDSNTTYHFRIVAENSVTTSYGADRTFTTQEPPPPPPPPPPGGSSGGSGGCFIATAAFGSYMEPHVKVLRDFRDACLLTNRVGQAFVHLYYKYSPPVADFLVKHGSLKTVVRYALYPLVGLSYVALHTTPAQQALIVLGLLSVLSSAVMVKRRQRRRDFQE